MRMVLALCLAVVMLCGAATDAQSAYSYTELNSKKRKNSVTVDLPKGTNILYITNYGMSKAKVKIKIFAKGNVLKSVAQTILLRSVAFMKMSVSCHGLLWTLSLNRQRKADLIFGGLQDGKK
ncbi:MAG: hypothetical protein K2I10_10385 [Lachnospiraceae bacterium]|nr:hypothetical protein [Lachnospiraceae bacterium]